MSSLATGGNPRSVFVSGNYAFLSVGLQGMAVIDISEPAAPEAAGFLDIPVPGAFIPDVFVDGGYAYVANGAEGLSIVERF